MNRQVTGIYALVFSLVLMGGWGPAAATVYYVDDSAPGGGNGLTWGTAFEDLQDAFALTAAGDEIRVGQGIYRPTAGASRNETFQLLDGVAVRGGYAGYGAGDPDMRNIPLYESVLSGDIGVPAVTDDNSYHVVTADGTDATALLEGFTISGGNADGPSPDNGGGGMQNLGGRPTVRACTFAENIGYMMGGAMQNKGGSNPRLEDCTFIGNVCQSAWGGAIVNHTHSSGTLMNCRFMGNQTGLDGGAILNWHGSSPELVNCIFTGNEAVRHGGAIYNGEFSMPVLINCTLSENEAGHYGGGIYTSLGVGFTGPTLDNCILWGNVDSDGLIEVAQVYGTRATIKHCCVQGWTGALGGTGNMGSDPCFMDADGPDDIFGTADDNLRLREGSPCLDAGDNDLVPPGVDRDLDGGPRIFDGDYDGDVIVDMGAYERAVGVLFADDTAGGANNGSSWDDAFTDLQDALNEAAGGGVREILVGQGTYYPSLAPDPCDDRTATFQFIDGLALRGSYAGAGAANPNVRNFQMSPSILSGDTGAALVGDDNSYHVVTCRNNVANAILDGFIVIAGNADGLDENGFGGGMLNTGNSSATVTNCIFQNNVAAALGGGMANLDHADTRLNHCTFIGNWGLGGAGAMVNAECSTMLSNCAFVGNWGFLGGSGAMSNYLSDTSLINCVFNGNIGFAGGAMNNSDQSEARLTNCTFSQNVGLGGAGGIDNVDSYAELRNCILWDVGPEIGVDPCSTVMVSHCNVLGGFLGPNNIAEPPLLIDPIGLDGTPGTGDEDLRLAPGSPCIDKGMNGFVPPEVDRDLAGRDRIVDGDCDEIAAVDMGAYEFSYGHYGDLSSDCFINLWDVDIFSLAWGSAPDAGNWNPNANLATPPDEIIDVADLLVIVRNWLTGLQ